MTMTVTRTKITCSSEIVVREIQHMGGDHMIAAAAKVSVNPEEAQRLAEVEGAEGIYGLIRYLARQKHHSPFEHGALTVYVKAPIFVFREWHRHRTQAFNEWSGRYSTLEPEFWLPRRERAMIPVEGYKAARPQFGPASDDEHARVEAELRDGYQFAWNRYEALLDEGIAKEVARAVLPVGVYSKMWATASLRNWLHFLSLRTHEPEAAFVSFPQAEIEEGARQVEAILTEHFPLALRAFNETGRAF